MYFAKVPVKKALSEAGLAQMTSAEQFWYVLQCIALGAGYLAKLPAKKALSELAAGGSARDQGAVFGMPPAPQPQAGSGYEPGGWPGDLPQRVPCRPARRGGRAGRKPGQAAGLQFRQRPPTVARPPRQEGT